MFLAYIPFFHHSLLVKQHGKKVKRKKKTVKGESQSPQPPHSWASQKKAPAPVRKAPGSVPSQRRLAQTCSSSDQLSAPLKISASSSTLTCKTTQRDGPGTDGVDHQWHRTNDDIAMWDRKKQKGTTTWKKKLAKVLLPVGKTWWVYITSFLRKIVSLLLFFPCKQNSFSGLT
jgi:hypothetical protein